MYRPESAMRFTIVLIAHCSFGTIHVCSMFQLSVWIWQYWQYNNITSNSSNSNTSFKVNTQIGKWCPVGIESVIQSIYMCVLAAMTTDSNWLIQSLLGDAFTLFTTTTTLSSDNLFSHSTQNIAIGRDDKMIPKTNLQQCSKRKREREKNFQIGPIESPSSSPPQPTPPFPSWTIVIKSENIYRLNWIWICISLDSFLSAQLR